MNKKRLLWVILDSIFLIIFNIIFFVFGGAEHETSVWISYGFIHFSYMMLIMTSSLIRKTDSASIFGFSLYSVSSAYFLIVFTIGIIFIFLHPSSYKMSLVMQVIIIGFYAILLISNIIANENTADQIEIHKTELRYVKDCLARLNRLSGSVSDKQLKKQIEKLYDLIQSSQVKSNHTATEYERAVIDLIGVLEKNIIQNDISASMITIDKIAKNAAERNNRLKYGN